MSEEQKSQGKKSLRDFLIGATAGASSAAISYPIDRMVDPVSSLGYTKAMAGRPFPTYLKHKIQELAHRKEWSAVPLKMFKSSLGFGTSVLVAGGLYRALQDKQPVEKQAALLIGQIFLSCRSKKS
jgi:hypothetical protein